MEKLVKVPLLQRVALLEDTLVILEEMIGPHGCPVAAGGPDSGQIFPESIKADVSQNLTAKAGGYLPHLLGDSGVVGSEVRMAGPGVNDAQGVAEGPQIHLHLPQLRVIRIFKVNGDDAPCGTGELVHKAAGLAEIDVLRVLAHFGKIGGGKCPAAEELIHDRGN